MRLFYENLESFVFVGGKSSFFLALISQFIHSGLCHLILNLLMLVGLFFISQQAKISGKLILISLISGWVVVGIALFLFSKKGIPYLGSSGFLASFLGICVVSLIKNNQKILAYELLLSFIGFTFLLPNVSNLMHFSGLVTGLILGFLYHLKKECFHDQSSLSSS